ncbi:hypothetical protein [Nonomuraea recticatena]|uniref:hypothetical protein n=1 Tax=Nonomuraea recticatena TaxID=46178 RepID=UPI0031F9E7B6
MTVSVAALVLARGGLAITATAFWGAAYAALPILLQTAVLKAARNAQTDASALFIITFNVSIAAGSILGGRAQASQHRYRAAGFIAITLDHGFTFLPKGLLVAAGPGDRAQLRVLKGLSH